MSMYLLALVLFAIHVHCLLEEAAPEPLNNGTDTTPAKQGSRVRRKPTPNDLTLFKLVVVIVSVISSLVGLVVLWLCFPRQRRQVAFYFKKQFCVVSDIDELEHERMMDRDSSDDSV